MSRSNDRDLRYGVPSPFPQSNTPFVLLTLSPKSEHVGVEGFDATPMATGQPGNHILFQSKE